jgi:hypothetical protein
MNPVSPRPAEWLSMSRKTQNDDYFICPCCGAQVRVGAVFCRECGASDEFGWDEDGQGWEDELPTGYRTDDDFDYDEFIGREFSGRATGWSKQRAKRLAMGVVVVIVCLALLFWTLMRW